MTANPHRRSLIALHVILQLAALAVPLLAQPIELDQVLSRIGQYLVDYEKRLSAVVAEERYEQWIEAGGRPMIAGTGRSAEVGIGRGTQAATRRMLVSDFLMIRWPGESAWFGFRDVLTVDGQPVRDREERLLKLFTQDSKDVLNRADAIAAESARYNIGDVFRNINVPTQALDFLHPRHRGRFSFRKTGEDNTDGTRAWKIEYTERERPFLIQTPSGEGVRAAGIAWVDPHDGSVIQTQLNLISAEARRVLRTQIIAVFRHQSTLGMRVPVELREMHEQSDPSRSGPPIQVVGRAEYRNFRRFQTTTEETIPALMPPAK